MPTESAKSLKLFYCYAREDKALRDELDKHLSGLKREYQIASWSDGEIIPGAEWQKEIDAQLNTANLILLLISTHFMASDYCYGIEMKRALERHEAGTARVIPIILRHVYWGNAPFSKLQVLPTDAKPVTQWSDRDEAFWDIAIGIRNAIKELIISLKGSDEKGKDEVKQEPSGKQSNHSQMIHDPSKIKEWLAKGLALGKLKRYEEALAAYEQVLRLDPNHADTWNNKGFALEKLGRPKEAQQCYEQILRLDPN